MSGCASYDCFGAGQHLTQATFAGADWRSSAETAARMFEAFTVMRQLHELAWYLAEALALTAARAVHPELTTALEEIEALTREPADALLAADVASRRQAIGALLGRASELARAGIGPGETGDARDRHGADLAGIDPAGADLAGADLAGADLRGRDLRGVSLRGAVLIRADLRRADLRRADLGGADLRGADLGGADLRGALFLAQSQVESANGGPATLLSPALARPAHWVPRG